MTKIIKSSIPAALGFFMTLICCAMIMILGSKAYVPIHDQLDGEVEENQYLGLGIMGR